MSENVFAHFLYKMRIYSEFSIYKRRLFSAHFYVFRHVYVNLQKSEVKTLLVAKERAELKLNVPKIDENIYFTE